jgi:hypothetical protein
VNCPLNAGPSYRDRGAAGSDEANCLSVNTSRGGTVDQRALVEFNKNELPAQHSTCLSRSLDPADPIFELRM